MKIRKRFWLPALLLAASAVHAHLLPEQHATLNVLGDSVFGVVMVPVSALEGVDDDRDGRLSAREVSAHAEALNAQIGARFRIYDEKGPGTREFISVRAEHAEHGEAADGPGARHVLTLLKTRFAKAPRLIRLETDLFGTAPDEAQFTIRATRGSAAEVAVLRAKAGAHVFFSKPAPTPRKVAHVRHKK